MAKAKLLAIWNGKKVADVETYLGYTIVLRTFDWGADYEVWRMNALLRTFKGRLEAKGWIDDQHYDIRKM